MSSGMLSGIATVILLICFLGVVLWTWSSGRKSSFEQAAMLPLEQDESVSGREKQS